MVSTEVSKTFSSSSNLDTPTMETTFRYKNKIITTPNLDKKLKRLKISINDIEIIQNEIKKELIEEEVVIDKRKVIVRSTIDDIRRVCYIPLDNYPTFEELFKNHLWNPLTKTGVRGITKEYLKTLYYEN